MKIKLYLIFPNLAQALSKSWDFSSNYWNASFPHPFAIAIGAISSFEVSSYSVNYPHTGDTHLLKDPYRDSPYKILFVSRQTDTSGITIYGEVLEIHREDTRILEDECSVTDTLLKHGWEQISEDEMQAWRRIMRLPPHLSLTGKPKLPK